MVEASLAGLQENMSHLATDFPWDMAEALRKRLEKRICIPLPNFESRKELVRINLESIEVAADVDTDEVSRRTEDIVEMI